MLFTELKKIQDNDIEQTLTAKLEARGIDPSILQQMRVRRFGQVGGIYAVYGAEKDSRQ